MEHCAEFAALLDPYLDGELSPEDAARVRAHLAVCDRCRAYVQAALAIRDAFPAAEDVELPEGFTENIMAAVRADRQRQRPRRSPWAKRLAPLAACCAVIVLAASLLPRLGGNTADMAAEQAVEEEASVEAPETDPAGGAPAVTAAGGAEESAAEDTAPAEYHTAAAMDADEKQESPSATVRAGERPAQEAAAEAAPAENGAGPVPFAADTEPVPALTLTAAEAGPLLDGCTPAAQEAGTLVYTLTAGAYADLLEQLEQQGMTVAGAASPEEAEAAGTVLVHVIPD